MKPKVIHGDCLDVMPTLDANSADAIVCDPPYGLAFMGKQWDHGVPGVPFWSAALSVAKPGAHIVAFGGTRTYHRLTCAIEDAGWEIRDCLSWLYGSGFPKSHNGAWGGTALKPAWEPIILARKPLTGTVATNVLEHGTGALNIDGCRIGIDPSERQTIDSRSGAGDATDGWGHIGIRASGEKFKSHGEGRWPANVCLDEEAAAMLDEQSGTLTSSQRQPHHNIERTHGSTYAKLADANYDDNTYADSGGASRFFYTAKASRSEREEGLSRMPRRRAGMMQDDAYEWKGTPEHAPHKTPAAANHHPTVKPLDLMRWLCRLVTPKGGLILDPFCGSGSTGCAAVLEDFRFIGIEREAEYVEIARARIAHHTTLFVPTLDLGGAA